MLKQSLFILFFAILFNNGSALYNAISSLLLKLRSDISLFEYEKDDVFCDKVKEANKKPNNTIQSNILVFEDLYPAARIHILSIPKNHIADINELTAKEIPLLQEMKTGCTNYFSDNNIDHKSAIYGFHIPPNITIHHLHLHCAIDPFDSYVWKFATPKEHPEGIMIYIEDLIDKLLLK